MSVVTERTQGGVRLRMVVSDGLWGRLQELSDALQIEDRKVLEMALSLGARYLSLMVNPASPELMQAAKVTTDREAREVANEVAAARGET